METKSEISEEDLLRKKKRDQKWLDYAQRHWPKYKLKKVLRREGMNLVFETESGEERAIAWFSNKK